MLVLTREMNEVIYLIINKHSPVSLKVLGFNSNEINIQISDEITQLIYTLPMGEMFKIPECFNLGDRIEVIPIHHSNLELKFLFKSPRSVNIIRKELYDRIKETSRNVKRAIVIRPGYSS